MLSIIMPRLKINSLPLVTLVLSAIWFIKTESTFVSAQEKNYPSCNPIGRIESGESDNYTRGEVVCSGSQILNPTNVSFWCFSNRRAIEITGTTFTVNSTACSQGIAIENSGSTICNREGLNRLLCFIPKTPREQQFQVLQPDVISGPRPEITWEAVPSAQSYRVYVVGTDIEWQREVPSGTSLRYPSSERALTIGFAYEVIVAANQDDQITASASKVVNVRDATAIRLDLHGHLAASLPYGLQENKVMTNTSTLTP